MNKTVTLIAALAAVLSDAPAGVTSSSGFRFTLGLVGGPAPLVVDTTDMRASFENAPVGTYRGTCNYLDQAGTPFGATIDCAITPADFGTVAPPAPVGFRYAPLASLGFTVA